MRDTVASWPMEAVSSSISMYGYVSERESSSRIRASQRTLDLALVEPSSTRTSPRYPARPPSLEMDLETMDEWVLGAAWTTLPPASCFFFKDTAATERI